MTGRRPTASPTGSRDLHSRLQESAIQESGGAAERALADRLREVGAAVRRLHDAGVDHRALQLRNILVVDEGGRRRIVVIDLDRAVYHPDGRLASRLRARGLGRLTRSVVKNGLWNQRVARRELAAFASAYTGRDRDLRVELRGWIRGERWKLALHRLRYRFMDSASPGEAAAPPRRA